MRIIPTTLFYLAIQFNTSYGTEASIQEVAPSEYVSLLEGAAALIKSNYEAIATWQGELIVQEDDYYYGDKCRRIPILPGEPAAASKSIRRSVTGLVNFALDTYNDKLYTEFIPTVEYKALDLNRDVAVNEKYSRIISIVTPEEYLSYQVDHVYAYRRENVLNGKVQGRAAFRLPLEKAKGQQWGHIRDPRRYFFESNRTMWDFLYTLRDTVAGKTDIPKDKAPQISMAREDLGDSHAKLHVKGGFHASPNCPSYDLEFLNITITLDSRVGLNMVRREVMDRSGRTLQTLDINYEEIGHVYLPKTVHFVIFTGEQKLFDSRITFSKSIINELIPEETFTYRNLGLKDGEQLCDKTRDLDYLYQNGELLPTAGK